MDETPVSKVSIESQFPMGAFVVPSELAIKDGRWSRSKRWGRRVVGKVVGWELPDTLLVHVAGRKCAMQWHRVFWEIAAPDVPWQP